MNEKLEIFEDIARKIKNKYEDVSLNLKNHEEEKTYWTVSGHFVHIFFCCCTSPGILQAGPTVIMILWLGSSVCKYVCIKLFSSVSPDPPFET